MSIIPCPECKGLISTVSGHCPFCKATLWPPMVKLESAAIYSRAIQLVGVMVAFLDVLAWLTENASLTPLFLCLGGILFLLGRIGTFWNHH